MTSWCDSYNYSNRWANPPVKKAKKETWTLDKLCLPCYTPPQYSSWLSSPPQRPWSTHNVIMTFSFGRRRAPQRVPRQRFWWPVLDIVILHVSFFTRSLPVTCTTRNRLLLSLINYDHLLRPLVCLSSTKLRHNECAVSSTCGDPQLFCLLSHRIEVSAKNGHHVKCKLSKYNKIE